MKLRDMKMKGMKEDVIRKKEFDLEKKKIKFEKDVNIMVIVGK